MCSDETCQNRGWDNLAGIVGGECWGTGVAWKRWPAGSLNEVSRSQWVEECSLHLTRCFSSLAAWQDHPRRFQALQIWPYTIGSTHLDTLGWGPGKSILTSFPGDSCSLWGIRITALNPASSNDRKIYLTEPFVVEFNLILISNSFIFIYCI